MNTNENKNENKPYNLVRVLKVFAVKESIRENSCVFVAKKVFVFKLLSVKIRGRNLTLFVELFQSSVYHTRWTRNGRRGWL